MRFWALLRVFIVVAMAPLAVHAQAPAQSVWVQVEAHPDLRTAQERARAYGQAFSDVNGFRLNSGWYALALGPFGSELDARQRLLELRNAGLIPGDAYISDWRPYRQQFWPIGGAVTVIPQPETPLIPQIEPADETPRQARASEALLTRDEKKTLQEYLEWFGFYTAAIDGSFGKGTRASMAAWQQSNGFETTGILTTSQRATLAAAYRGSLAQLGLGEVIETTAGISITMPEKLVSFEKYDYPFVHYAPKDSSDIRVLLISQRGSETTLAGLYDIMQTLEIVPLEGQRELKRRSFTLTGQDAKLHSHSYARLENGVIKGFTLAYPPEKAADMARVIPIMRESLVVLDGALAPEQSDEAAQSVDLLSGLELRQPKSSRSGYYVDDRGWVLTSAAAVQSCERVTFDGDYDAEIVALDGALALLRPKTDLAPLHYARFATSPGLLRSEIALSGYSYEGSLQGASLSYGTLTDIRGLNAEAGTYRLDIDALVGDVGGPVLSTSGAVIAMLLPKPDGSRTLPGRTEFAAGVPVLAQFLVDNGVNVAATDSSDAIAPEDLAQLGQDMTVLVGCW